MPRQSRILNRKRSALIAAALLLSTIGIAGAATVGAESSCGSLNFSFTGTRLLNDGISHNAGPFAIDLPAGTYDVMMRSADEHSTQDSQEGQEAERWWFALDSGWHSMATTDLPDARDANTTVMQRQAVPASGAITLHHLGQGGINSVNPVCVGFTPVPPVDEEPGDPAIPGDPDPNGADPDDGDPNGADPNEPARANPDPNADTPDDGDPARANPDPGADTPGDGDPNGADPNDGDPNGADPDEPARANPDPDTPGDPDPNDPGRTPDQPVVPELAITGSGVLTIRLVGAALILFQVGFLLLLADRRRTA